MPNLNTQQQKVLEFSSHEISLKENSAKKSELNFSDQILDSFVNMRL